MIPSISDIIETIKNRMDEILNWTKRLMSFPSENKPPTGYEGKAQMFLKNELLELGLDVYDFYPDEIKNIEKHPYWLKGRDYSNNRKNLVATWKGIRPGRSLLLSGHIDVAPKEPDKWTVCRPYEPLVKDGRLCGRGSADMKGGFSSMLWAIKILKEFNFNPEGEIIFESLVDEEYAGGNGTLAARLKGFNADFAIISEPSRMEICPASLGAFLGKIKIEGRSGMPYMGKGLPNPVNAVSRLIGFMEDWQSEWRRINSHPLFKEQGKELNVILWDMVSGKREEFVQMGVPSEVSISWIVFCYPGTEEKDFYKIFLNYINSRIKRDEYLRNFNIDIMKEYHFVRPWETDIENEGVKEISKVYREYCGITPGIGGAPFSCDLAIYGDPGGMPAIILGPRGGNLHAPDEWVLVEDILTLTGIYAYFITKWCSN